MYVKYLSLKILWSVPLKYSHSFLFFPKICKEAQTWKGAGVFWPSRELFPASLLVPRWEADLDMSNPV